MNREDFLRQMLLLMVEAIDIGIVPREEIIEQYVKNINLVMEKEVRDVQ